MKTKVYLYNYSSNKKEGKTAFDFHSLYAYESIKISKTNDKEIFLYGRLPQKHTLWISIIENCINLFESKSPYHKTVQITDEEKL